MMMPWGQRRGSRDDHPHLQQWATESKAIFINGGVCSIMWHNGAAKRVWEQHGACQVNSVCQHSGKYWVRFSKELNSTPITSGFPPNCSGTPLSPSRKPWGTPSWTNPPSTTSCGWAAASESSKSRSFRRTSLTGSSWTRTSTSTRT